VSGSGGDKWTDCIFLEGLPQSMQQLAVQVLDIATLATANCGVPSLVLKSLLQIKSQQLAALNEGEMMMNEGVLFGRGSCAATSNTKKNDGQKWSPQKNIITQHK
jgi:hypothetical protein